jgi:hypothetical protein
MSRGRPDVGRTCPIQGIPIGVAKDSFEESQSILVAENTQLFFWHFEDSSSIDAIDAALRLSDVELTAVMNACGPLSPAMRATTCSKEIVNAPRDAARLDPARCIVCSLGCNAHSSTRLILTAQRKSRARVSSVASGGAKTLAFPLRRGGCCVAFT